MILSSFVFIGNRRGSTKSPKWPITSRNLSRYRTHIARIASLNKSRVIASSSLPSERLFFIWSKARFAATSTGSELPKCDPPLCFLHSRRVSDRWLLSEVGAARVTVYVAAVHRSARLSIHLRGREQVVPTLWNGCRLNHAWHDSMSVQTRRRRLIARAYGRKRVDASPG